MDKKKHIVLAIFGGIAIAAVWIVVFVLIGNYIWELGSLTPIFSDINELDAVEELTLTSQQSNFEEDGLQIIEKRTYDCDIDGKLIKVEAYVFNDVESAKLKYCKYLDLTNVTFDSGALSWQTHNFDSEYVVYKDNRLLYAKTSQGHTAMKELLEIFDEKLTDKHNTIWEKDSE